MDFKNKKALVSGVAKSGISAARLLKKLGAEVTIQDAKTEDKLGDVVSELKSEGINLFLGANPDDIVEGMDILVMSPGVPTDLPFVEKAKKAGVKVMGEIELAWLFCKSPVIGITGTNGKTTTTTLVGEILKAYFKNSYVVGNIGNPFADCCLDTTEDGCVVAELSSFQLETIDTFKPKVSAVLNITPDHLNRHHTLENYIAAKERVFENQDEKPTNSFLYSLVMDTYSINGYSSAPFLDMPLNHKVFLAQFETIKKIAEKESCVIVGRCADYALAENPNCINVFIHADKEFRTKRVAAELQVNESKAKDAIQKKDKQRASYYNYYTSKKWGDSRSYHLTLDSSALGIDKCVEMILQYRALYLMK